MNSFGSTAWSSIGKKVITGITGFCLIGFIIVHLLGNLTIFIGPDAFNHYAHFLESLIHGWFIYAFEAGLIAIFVFHMVSAFTVAWTDKRAARKEGYKYAKNAGGTSRKTLASRTMIYGGALIIIFVIGHVWTFKFGDHEILPGGVKNLLVMAVLGFHLRHGFWSAFQSLGWTNDRWLPLLVNVARVFAWLIAIAFIGLPIYMYFFVDPASASAAVSGGH